MNTSLAYNLCTNKLSKDEAKRHCIEIYQVTKPADKYFAILIVISIFILYPFAFGSDILNEKITLSFIGFEKLNTLYNLTTISFPIIFLMIGSKLNAYLLLHNAYTIAASRHSLFKDTEFKIKTIQTDITTSLLEYQQLEISINPITFSIYILKIIVFTIGISIPIFAAIMSFLYSTVTLNKTGLSIFYVYSLSSYIVYALSLIVTFICMLKARKCAL